MTPKLANFVRLRELAQFLILPAVIVMKMAPSNFTQRVELAKLLWKIVWPRSNVIGTTHPGVSFDALASFPVGLSMVDDLRSAHELVD